MEKGAQPVEPLCRLLARRHGDFKLLRYFEWSRFIDCHQGWIRFCISFSMNPVSEMPYALHVSDIGTAGTATKRRSHPRSNGLDCTADESRSRTWKTSSGGDGDGRRRRSVVSPVVLPGTSCVGFSWSVLDCWMIYSPNKLLLVRDPVLFYPCKQFAPTETIPGLNHSWVWSPRNIRIAMDVGRKAPENNMVRGHPFLNLHLQLIMKYH